VWNAGFMPDGTPEAKATRGYGHAARHLQQMTGNRDTGEGAQVAGIESGPTYFQFASFSRANNYEINHPPVQQTGTNV